MTGKVGAASDLAFGLQVEREHSCVKRKLSAIESGATVMCSKEKDLWLRFATLREEDELRRERAGRPYFDHGARDNLEKMGAALRRIHELCKVIA